MRDCTITLILLLCSPGGATVARSLAVDAWQYAAVAACMAAPRSIISAVGCCVLMLMFTACVRFYDIVRGNCSVTLISLTRDCQFVSERIVDLRDLDALSPTLLVCS